MVTLTITLESTWVRDDNLRDFLLQLIQSGEKPPAGIVDDLKEKGEASITSPLGKAVYTLR